MPIIWVEVTFALLRAGFDRGAIRLPRRVDEGARRAAFCGFLVIDAASYLLLGRLQSAKD
jgi:hypothetical protein